MSTINTAFKQANNIIRSHPTTLLPAIIVVAVSILISIANLGLPGALASSIIRFLAYSVMTAYIALILRKGEENLNKAWNTVTTAIVTLILLALVATVFTTTIILIPVALFLIPIAIIDKANTAEAIRRAFNFVANNIKEVIIMVIILIIAAIIAYAIPAAIARTDPRTATPATLAATTLNEIILAYFTILATTLYYLKTRGTPTPKQLQETLPPPPPPPPKQP